MISAGMDLFDMFALAGKHLAALREKQQGAGVAQSFYALPAPRSPMARED